MGIQNTRRIDMDAGSPIKSFIEKVRKEVEEGIGDWELKSPIELELSTVVEGDAETGLDIKVIKLGANIKAEETQKIKMSIGPKSIVEEEEKRARIAKAKADETVSKAKIDSYETAHGIALKRQEEKATTKQT